MNLSPSRAIECKTPHEVWSGTPADYSGLHIFGCPTYAHVNEGKFKHIAKKCISIGYASSVKEYKLWCIVPKSPKFTVSRDIIFYESFMLN